MMPLVPGMSSRRVVEWTLESWPVEALVKLVRHDIADEKVAELTNSLAEGKELPPVFVLVDGPRSLILDGHHRAAAWGVAGVSPVEVIVGRPR